MPLRQQAYQRAHHQFRLILGAALAVPVLAWVYAASLVARLRPVRPAALVAALLVGSVALEALSGGGTVTAVPPSTPGPLSASAFQELALPSPEATAQPTATASAAGPDPFAAAPTPDPTLAPSKSAVAAVVRFRPRGGETSIPRESAVSVRFTVPMDRAATAAAFRVTVSGAAVKGRSFWAEGDTVLVFVPAAPFAYGARVTLAVTRDARSAEGTAIRAARSVAFVVVGKPAARPSAPPAASAHPSSAWIWPLIGPITQYFGQSLTVYGYHYGIDIDGQTGDPVHAAGAGIVTVAGYYDSCGGLQVRIDHGNGFESQYHHLSRLAVHVGERVSAGTLIGEVGATGCAFGSHLHFAIRLHGVFVDPLRYLPRR